MPRRKKKNEEKAKDLMKKDIDLDELELEDELDELDELDLDELDNFDMTEYNFQIDCPHCKKQINIAMLVSKQSDVLDLNDYLVEDDIMIDKLRSLKK